MDSIWLYLVLCSLFTFLVLAQNCRDAGDEMEYWDRMDWLIILFLTVVFPIGWVVIIAGVGWRLFQVGKQEK